MTITDDQLRERTRGFLDDNDHTELSMHEFRGAQFDAGLALVHFPENKGGLGLSRASRPSSTRSFARPGSPTPRSATTRSVSVWACRRC